MDTQSIRTAAFRIAVDAITSARDVPADVAGSLAAFPRIVVPTHRRRKRHHGRLQAHALALSRATAAEIVLYDRTAESIFFDPFASESVANPDGLLDRGELPSSLSYLSTQLYEIERAGVPAKAFIVRRSGTRPLEACVDRAGCVLMPEELGRPSLIDRVRGVSLTSFAEVVDVPFLVSHADDSISRLV